MVLLPKLTLSAATCLLRGAPGRTFPSRASFPSSLRTIFQSPRLQSSLPKVTSIVLLPATRNPVQFIKRLFASAPSKPLASAVAGAVTGSGVASAAAAAAGTGAGAVATPYKAVGYWLLGCCGLVFTTVVIGGVTRLTESGLSIVRWEPIKGIAYPTSQEEWLHQFELYKQYPEFKYNSKVTLEEFKFIFFMEWAHRILGRLVGLSFVLPAAFFWARGRLLPKHKPVVLALGSLIGFQGALGWYMVKSGLDHDPQGAHVPRVSQYRLAAHLGSAFLLHCGMFWTALQYFPQAARTVASYGRLPVLSAGVAALTYVTALSGAFVAGLDAGLVYNSFPKMGDDWIPKDILALSPTIRNFFENTTTVQFDHRVLAIATLLSINSLFIAARGVPGLHRRARVAVTGLTHMSWLQVALGISTLLYFVPTPLAASHQAGSLTLLTLALWFTHEVKRLPK